MVVLAIETSSLKGSLALFRDKELVDFAEWSRTGSHSELLNQSLVSLMSKNQMTLQDINRLAVGVGPGSFTGIRVGINFVRTMAYSLKLPVYTCNSLYLLASQTFRSVEGPVLALQYGFRNLIYCQCFQKSTESWIAKEPPLALTPDKIISTFKDCPVVVGTGFNLISTELSKPRSGSLSRDNNFSDEPHAKFFINTPALDESPAELFDWMQVKPLYIRASEAEEKLKAGVLSPL